MKKIFKKIIEFIQTIYKQTQENRDKQELENYLRFIDKAFNSKTNQIITNFSYEGYKRIFEKLIGFAQNNVYIFCEKYDKIFNDELFPLFELKAKHGLLITIISTEENEKFRKLADQYINVKYNIFKKVNPNELISNFIVSDNVSYWIDDKYIPRNKFEVLKSIVNFFDCVYCAKLIEICECYEQHLK